MDPEIGILYRDISQFKDTEIPKAIELIQAVARDINGELAAKGHSGGHMGKLDFRRTIRKGLETGGSFYRLRYRKKRTKRKRLVLLCDVSGSMVQFSEFALRFIQSLNQVSESSRVFLFSETAVEADAFRLQNMDLFRSYVKDSGIYGRGTDLGEALETLCAMHPSVLGASATLLIQNHRPAPGGRGGAGGKASGGTGDLPEPYPGGEVAVYQKRSDHGVHLPHGIVQHPAGAGLGLPQTDKGNVNKLTALRAVGTSGRKLPDGFDGWS